MLSISDINLNFWNTWFNDGNIQNVWIHSTKLSGQGFKCGYCGFKNVSGGATWLSDHLRAIVGEVRACSSVPRAVRDAMRELGKSLVEKKREREHKLERDLMQGLHGDDNVIDLESDEEDQARMEIRRSLRKSVSCAIQRRGVSVFVLMLTMCLIPWL
ncbi:hypothetical protein HU200_033577 [Digitaria exilis]|uniref:BED-type domain-containing protein n=1 Tax=Digitaria exilis TaxID=1010633 RepID=A0A835ENB5_9POAL|nr:hypothetical protein HU200_033577 [Digitaria exilis]